MTSLAIAMRQQGKAAEAIDWLKQALQWQLQHTPGNAAQIAATEANIGIALAELGEDVEAEATLSRALPMLGKDGVPAAGIVRRATEALAGLYERTGRSQDAQRLRESLKAND
jgi:tetratricopeptide (TPR) repeat protein